MNLSDEVYQTFDNERKVNNPMYCLKCGKKISDQAEFCPYCGADQSLDSEYLDRGYTDPRFVKPGVDDLNANYEDPRYVRSDYGDYEDPRFVRSDYGNYEDSRYSDRDYDEPRYSDRDYDDSRYYDLDYDDSRYSDRDYDEPRYSSRDYDDSRYSDRDYDEPRSKKPKAKKNTKKKTVKKTTYVSKKKKKHSPAGIILVALLTVGAFFLVVFGTDSIVPKISEITHKIGHSISGDKSDKAPEETPGDTPAEAPADVDPMVGSYSAVSAVYEGHELNSVMLKLSGTKISLDVFEDGTFSAVINSDTYSGNWYRDGDYAQFDANNLSMTGSFSDGTLSVSEESQGISVVMKKK